MKLRKVRAASTVALVVLSLVGSKAQGQSGANPQRLAAVQTQLSQVKKLLGQLPETQRRLLSSGAQNMLQIAERFDQVAQGLESPQVFPVSSNAPTTLSPGPVPVSNQSTDFLFSVLAGFTQSETSTAWCGSNIVVGFNDSGSFYESLLFGSGGVSFSGAAFSTDGGFTFRDVGFVNPGPNPFNFLGGDPVVNCISRSTFYYTQIFSTGTPIPFAPLAAVSFSKSMDGGATWADPVPAVAKDGFTHFLDKDWSAVDPANRKNVYVTYTDIEFSSTSCPMATRYAIELVHSANGGLTWGAPTVVDQFCSAPPSFPLVQGSQVAVDSDGTVYVAWEAFPSGSTARTREMRIAKSKNAGATFKPFVKIDDITPVGDGFALQGGLRNNEFPTLAIDRSGRATDGTLYVAWNDGRNLKVPDQESPTGFYGYADILLSGSSDGGKTWSPAVRVNTDPIALSNGRGTDQFQPGVAVDRTGTVGACWYDRSGDPMNYMIGRTCGVSKNRGSIWSNTPATSSIWPPIHAADAIVNPYYLGDYDQLSSDFTNTNSGFGGAYGNVSTSGVFVPNQDVFFVLVP
jgi:hypothetical protein